MAWTREANGPQGDDDHDRDDRPTTWNDHYFEFVGILSVALPHGRVQELFLAPIAAFTEEAFLDAAATFLRGFDRATLAIDTRNPDNPAGVRAFVAERVRRGRGFRYHKSEKSFSVETHLGNALNAIFYQPSRWAHRGRATIPQRWSGLLDTMPTLTQLTQDAPASGAVATAFLNLVDASPCGALLPYVVSATSGWVSAYGVDANFWSEKTIGTRVCISITP
jgi:hypothetical protein